MHMYVASHGVVVPAQRIRRGVPRASFSGVEAVAGSVTITVPWCLQIRDSSVGVAGVDLVLPMCVLDTLEALQATAGPGSDVGTTSTGAAPDAVVATSSFMPDEAAPAATAVTHEAGCRAAGRGGEEAGGGGASGEGGGVDGGVGAALLAGLPEGHSAAAVHAALEEERAEVRLRTAEGVAAAAAAFRGLRGALRRHLLAAQAALAGSAGAAAEREPVLRGLLEAVAAARAALAEQRGAYEADSRCAVARSRRNAWRVLVSAAAVPESLGGVRASPAVGMT